MDNDARYLGGKLGRRVPHKGVEAADEPRSVLGTSSCPTCLDSTFDGPGSRPNTTATVDAISPAASFSSCQSSW